MPTTVVSEISARRLDKILIVQRVVAAIYFVAGILKPFPDFIAPGVPDNVPVFLRLLARNNAGTVLEAPSVFFAGHPWLIILVVGSAMVSLGVVYWLDRGLVRAAAVGNVLLLGCLITFVHRTWPKIVPADSLMVVVAILIFWRAHRRRVETARGPTTEGISK